MAWDYRNGIGSSHSQIQSNDPAIGEPVVTTSAIRNGIPPEAYLTPQKAEELHDCIVLGPKPLSHHAGSIRRASNPRPETQPPLILLCQLGRYPLWHAHKFTQEQLLGRFEPEPVADLAMDLRQ